LHEFGGAGGVAFFVQESQVPIPDSFITSVADSARDGEDLGVVLDGAFHLPQVPVGVPQVAQMIIFPAPVADFAGDGEGCW